MCQMVSHISFFSEQLHKNELWIEQQAQCLCAFTADRQYIIVTGLCTQEDEPMDLRVLEYFLTVADEENISHAAELLHVSQPTISRQLMELEEELDRKLFVRTNKKVILTEEGVLFRETAEDILKLYYRARADHTGQSELEGEIYIACGEIESFDLVAGKIRDFHLNHPKVQFHIHSGNAEEICAAIDKGTADIGYIVQSVNTMKYEVFSLNTSEQWGILVNRNHRLAAK